MSSLLYRTRDGNGNDIVKEIKIKEFPIVKKDFKCPICHKEQNQGNEMKKIVSSNFTDWGYIDGDMICTECSRLFSLYFYSYYEKKAEKLFADNWNASKDRYGTFYHEIGHAVWEDLSSEAKSQISAIYEAKKHEAYLKWMEAGGSSSGMSQTDYFGKTLSRYGATNKNEFFSEAFSQIMSGRMRPVSRQVNQILQEQYASVQLNKNLLDKSAQSGIMEVGSEEMYRKSHEGKIEPMPKKQFRKIEKAFKARGGIIQYDDATDEYLKSKNAEAITYNETTILIRKNAGRASIFEELIHTAQYRSGENDGSYLSRLKCEISAQEKLLKNAKAYKLTEPEIIQTKKALQAYKNELDEYIKNGGV